MVLTESSGTPDTDACRIATRSPQNFALPANARASMRHVDARMENKNLHDAPFDEHWPARRVILLGASTGGVEALIEVLSGFPSDCPPTFLVQHTGGGFSAGLARLLDNRVGIHVREAEDGMLVRPGTAVLGPGDRFHMEASLSGPQPRCRLIDQPVLGGHRPAIDVLFKSAVPHAKRVVAAILTGMGRDGADGLLALKNAGARTFGQNEATSLVYGMPKVASEIGAVELQLPLDRIAPALIEASFERTER